MLYYRWRLQQPNPALTTRYAGDDNAYTLGEILGHNIVIACLPSGVWHHFCCNCIRSHANHLPLHSLWLDSRNRGVPSTKNDIRLGDVVVSKPTGALGGVVQYDHGKTVASGVFQQTGMMNHPPQVLLNAMSRLHADELLGNNRSIVDVISNVLNTNVENERCV